MPARPLLLLLLLALQPLLAAGTAFGALPAAAAAPANTNSAEGIHLVLGSFSSQRRAERWTRDLSQRFPLDLHITSTQVPADHSRVNLLPGRVYRVLAGPFQRAGAGNAARQEAWRLGITDAWFLRDLAELGDDLTLVAAVPSIAPAPTPTSAEPEPGVATSRTGNNNAAENRRPAVFVAQGPPPGFEFLLAEQTSMVDVYYSDRLLTSTLATFDQHSITLANPEDLLGQFSTLTQPAAVAAALARPLATNSQNICSAANTTNCGVLEPAVAGVIFDADRFRLDLFVHPDHLRTNTPEVARYLPGANPNFSFLHNLNATLSGSAARDDTRAYSAGIHSTLAWGQNRVAAVSNLSDADGLAFDSLYFQRDHEGREYLAGLYRSTARSLPFSGDQDLYGVRLGSSLRTRADLDFNEANPIEVFLPARARVEILRDGRLLLARFLEAGNHQLDTSTLPDGAYDITLRIRDSRGSREETRLFVKTGRLPPMGTTLWFLEAGQLADRSSAGPVAEPTGVWMLRGGASQRLGENFGAEGGLTLASSGSLAEAGLFHFGRHHRLQTNVFVADDGSRGAAATLDLNAGLFQASTDLRWVDNNQAGSSAAADADADINSLVGESLQQQALYLYYPLAGGQLRASARRTQRGDATSTSSQGLGFSWPVLRTLGGNLELTLDLSRNDDDTLALAGLRWMMNTGSTSMEIQPQYQLAGSDSSAQLSSFVGWQGNTPIGADLRSSLVATSRSGFTTMGGNLDLGHNYGDAQMGLNWTDNQGEQSLSWSGSLNTSILGSTSGVSLGGRNQAQAAVLIDIGGEANNARMEVLVDGYRVGEARTGSTTAIHLKPFESYEIRLRAMGTELIEFDDRPEYITLYPGNVVRLQWQANSVVVVLGRILDPSGEPIRNLAVTGAAGPAATDHNGMLQAEVVARGATAEFHLEHLGGCTARADLGHNRHGVAMAGDMLCQPASH